MNLSLKRDRKAVPFRKLVYLEIERDTSPFVSLFGVSRSLSPSLPFRLPLIVGRSRALTVARPISILTI